MRPRSEVRQALVGAFHDLARMQPNGATWREAAQRAQVGFDAAKVCTRNMEHAGELQRVGTVKTEHACRPMVRYVPTELQREACAPLEAALRGWAAFD